MVVLSRYRFKRSSNFLPRASTLLAWADVRVGFPSALMRVCNCGDHMERLGRHLTSEGCNMQYFLHGEDIQCAPYYKNTITYSTSVL